MNHLRYKLDYQGFDVEWGGKGIFQDVTRQGYVIEKEGKAARGRLNKQALTHRSKRSNYYS